MTNKPDNTLRQELVEHLTDRWSFITLSEEDAQIVVNDMMQAVQAHTDSILRELLEELPDEYHFVQYREFLVADKKMRLEDNQSQAQTFIRGFNQALDQVTSVIQEKLSKQEEKNDE